MKFPTLQTGLYSAEDGNCLSAFVECRPLVCCATMCLLLRLISEGECYNFECFYPHQSLLIGGVVEGRRNSTQLSSSIHPDKRPK